MGAKRYLRQFLGILLLCWITSSGTAQRKAPTPPSKVSPAVRTEEASRWFSLWLNEDVRWIITSEERAAFSKLSNGEERQTFVDQFWDRRDPTPQTLDNEYKDTHYQRMLYANQHLGANSKPGWSTPRGRIYVIYGLPDEIDKQAGKVDPGSSVISLGTTCDTLVQPGEFRETWHYRNIAGVDHAVTISFADLCGSGELIPLVNKADAELLNRPPVPKYKDPCGNDYVPTTLPNGMQLVECLAKPPRVQFKDLEEIVTHKVHYNLVPFQVRTSSEKITNITDMMQLSVIVKNSNVTAQSVDGSSQAPVQVFARLQTIEGRIAQTLEGMMNGSVDTADGSRAFTRSIPLPVGPYYLNVVVKDVNGDKVGTYSGSLEINH
jgi:GWxTD domain-containing protein